LHYRAAALLSASPNAIREKLASDLAPAAGVKVPKVEFDQVEGRNGLFAISHAHGKESIDISLLRERHPEEYNSATVQDAIKGASGMIVFHAWTATVDQKDDHLVLARGDDGTYHVAGVDHQHSFQWQEPDGGPVRAPSVPPCLQNNIDKSRVEAATTDIENISDQQIRNDVNALNTSEDEKKRLSEGLIGRKGKVRECMKAQGWLN
jgi:hypothetical protein